VKYRDNFGGEKIMTVNLICSECGGTMTLGFIPDDSYVASRQLSWIEGPPKENFLGFLSTKGKQRHYIIAYRCKRCGFVKLYAGIDNSGE
jgi:hypothetical protein